MNRRSIVSLLNASAFFVSASTTFASPPNQSLIERTDFTCSAEFNPSAESPSYNLFAPFAPVTDGKYYRVKPFTSVSGGAYYYFQLCGKITGFKNSDEFGYLDSASTFIPIFKGTDGVNATTVMYQPEIVAPNKAWQFAFKAPRNNANPPTSYVTHVATDSSNEDSKAHIIAQKIVSSGTIDISKATLQNESSSCSVRPNDIVLYNEDLLFPFDGDYNDTVVVGRVMSSKPPTCDLVHKGIDAKSSDVVSTYAFTAAGSSDAADVPLSYTYTTTCKLAAALAVKSDEPGVKLSISNESQQDCKLTVTVSNGAYSSSCELAVKTKDCTPSTTATPTNTPKSTNTATRTATATPTSTNTPTRTSTTTPTSTPTLLPTSTPTLVPTRTSTPAPTATVTSTSIPTNTATRTPTRTPTITVTNTATTDTATTEMPTSTPTPVEVIEGSTPLAPTATPISAATSVPSELVPQNICTQTAPNSEIKKIGNELAKVTTTLSNLYRKDIARVVSSGARCGQLQSKRLEKNRALLVAAIRKEIKDNVVTSFLVCGACQEVDLKRDIATAQTLIKKLGAASKNLAKQVVQCAGKNVPNKASKVRTSQTVSTLINHASTVKTTCKVCRNA